MNLESTEAQLIVCTLYMPTMNLQSLINGKVVLAFEKERHNHQFPQPVKHFYKSIAIFMHHIKFLLLLSKTSSSQTACAFIPITEINPRS